MAALLSYLVPGLGQILQGRIAKGILFFVCVYTLFFYGMAMGSWKNVYVSDTTAEDQHFRFNLGGAPILEFNSAVLGSLWKRPHFAGQFWVGIAVWPALYQAARYESTDDAHPPLGGFMRLPPNSPPDYELEKLQRDSDKRWDLAWVYTVIAGVLNVMVIYDAYAGPAFVVRPGRRDDQPAQAAASPTPAR